jgi:hypothetical protein
MFENVEMGPVAIAMNEEDIQNQVRLLLERGYMPIRAVKSEEEIGNILAGGYLIPTLIYLEEFKA